MMNVPTHNTSLLNTSARGLNTTINFLKSTYTLTKVQKKIIKEEDEENYNEDSDVSSNEMDCAELNILFPDKVEKIKT